MQRILVRGLVSVAILTLGLAGCDGGGGGDVGAGMPTDNKGYVPLGGPNGAPPPMTDMTKIGNKPPAVKKTPTTVPAEGAEPAK